MELFELNKMIRENKTPCKMLFLGEESTLQNMYIKQLAKTLNSNICWSDDYLEIKKLLENNSPLSKLKVFVIRNDNKFLKDETLFENIQIKGNKKLILIFDKVDMRKKFFTKYVDLTCKFEKMTNYQLKNEIRKKLPNLNDDNCEILIQLVSNDYGRLLLEMEKIKILNSTFQDLEINQLFKEVILKEQIIFQECSDTSWELIDSILIKDRKKAHRLYMELKEYNDEPLPLLALIYNNFKNLLLLKSNKDGLNISSFQKNKLLKYINNFNSNTLIDYLFKIQEIERGIKTGKIDVDNAIDYLLVSIL